ncbi:helix-turn-helix domain-containing protein [Heyndrickxia ginsengihumi]|uniref:helix-turn-helix domain-containing protein n=1 Tax=Heyndrickxia ginsengihumi TaxID=363870 RepID=UPI0004B3CCCE|nr:helix-turn-helix transcriptional regulator [Heyndrickxia ginsengihumi]
MGKRLQIGDIIKKKREEKNWTLRELSDVSGISMSYISMLERGLKKFPSVKVIKKLAKSLDFSQEQLLEIIGYMENNDEENENIFFFDLNGLSEEDIELIEKQIEFLRDRAKKKNQNNKTID